MSQPPLIVPPAAAVQTETLAVPGRALWRDYVALTKPEISFLVTLSALAGYFLGTGAELDLARLFATLVGVGLTSCGASVLNHYLERGHDAGMRRTMTRPIPSGRISAGRARLFGQLLVMAGVGLLCPLTNPLTGVLAALTVVLYLYVYTPLKRTTPWNTLVGTVPGALPALGGFTAATGETGPAGWIFFGILVTWQMPHFLSLAWMYRKDYERAGYQMLPVVEPDGASTVRQSLVYTLLLLVLSLALPLTGAAGPIYLVSALLLGAAFLVPALAFFRSRSVQDARRVLKASIYYIPLLVAAIVLDWFL